MAERNPYRENPKRTVCEAQIYDQGYETALKDLGGYLERQQEILANDLGYRLAFIDGLVDTLKKGEMPEEARVC